MTEAEPSSAGTEGELIRAAVAGDTLAWQELVRLHEGRLRQMIRSRLDARLRCRLDASDILQDVYMIAARQLPKFDRDANVPVYFWLRGIAKKQVMAAHRAHLGAEMRDQRREVHGPAGPAATSVNLAEMIANHDTLPSGKLIKQEELAKLVNFLDQLEPLDREVLALRHFEQLSNTQTAQILEIETSAASKRYLRALQRLARLFSSSE